MTTPSGIALAAPTRTRLVAAAAVRPASIATPRRTRLGSAPTPRQPAVLAHQGRTRG